jgi:hypothetical protein
MVIEKTMDKSFARRRLMAALKAIQGGKALNDVISLPGCDGENTLMTHALKDAETHLGDEYFDREGLELAQRAMVTLNIRCFSLREGAVAEAILDAFYVRGPSCRRKSMRRR